MTLFELIPLVTLSALGVGIIIEDMRYLHINAFAGLGFTLLAIACGVILPLPGLSASAALAGASIAMATATATRGYIHLRTGVPAFGGADIALITAAGAMIGPYILGPWILFTIIFALILSVAFSKAGFRTAQIDGEAHKVMPLCPAILVSLGLTYIMLRTGLISVMGPLG
jgi:hypothetical protein